MQHDLPGSKSFVVSSLNWTNHFAFLAPPFTLTQCSFGDLGILHAERALGAQCWWLGALSNRKRPVVKLWVLDSKMLIMCSTCSSRLSAEKYPSWFFPALKTIYASLGFKSYQYNQLPELFRLTLCHLTAFPTHLLACQISSGKDLHPFFEELLSHWCGSTESFFSHWHRMWTHYEWQE